MSNKSKNNKSVLSKYNKIELKWKMNKKMIIVRMY